MPRIAKATTGKRKRSSRATTISKKVKKEEEETLIKEEETTIAAEPQETMPSDTTTNNNEEKSSSPTDTNKQKNKKKFFWPVKVKSAQFDSVEKQQDIKQLIKYTEMNGQDFIQYCCLGLLLDTDMSFVFNKRFKNVIVAHEGVEVLLLEILYSGKGTQHVIEHKCRPDSKQICYSPMKYLNGVYQGTSKLAWKILYEDGSFDIHVMTEKAVKTVQNNTKGEFKDFITHFGDSVAFYDPEMASEMNVERPVKAPQLDIIQQPDPIQEQLKFFKNASQEDQEMILSQMTNHLMSTRTFAGYCEMMYKLFIPQQLTTPTPCNMMMYETQTQPQSQSFFGASYCELLDESSEVIDHSMLNYC